MHPLKPLLFVSCVGLCLSVFTPAWAVAKPKVLLTCQLSALGCCLFDQSQNTRLEALPCSASSHYPGVTAHLHGITWRLQGVHHTAEDEEGPTAGCCCSPHPERVAAASGQKERLAAHPQDAADKGRPLPATSGKFDQVRLCQDQA